MLINKYPLVWFRSVYILLHNNLLLRTKFIPFKCIVVYLFFILSPNRYHSNRTSKSWLLIPLTHGRLCVWLTSDTAPYHVCVCVVDTKDDRNFQNWIITLLTMSLYVASKYVVVVVNHRSSKLKQKVLFCLHWSGHHSQ